MRAIYYVRHRVLSNKSVDLLGNLIIARILVVDEIMIEQTRKATIRRQANAYLTYFEFRKWIVDSYQPTVTELHFRCKAIRDCGGRCNHCNAKLAY